MLKIGITGGIGSGKTTVCKIFEVLGIPVFYADQVAKEIMITDKKLKRAVQNTFGEQSYTNEGVLNNKYLASIVFNDKKKLDVLNGIVHPAVFNAFDSWVLNQDGAPYIVKEAALLFESESYKTCDYCILIKAPIDLKIQRVMQRNPISVEEIKARMNRQFTDEKKEKMSDFVLINDEKQLLIPQILRLNEEFQTKN